MRSNRTLFFFLFFSVWSGILLQKYSQKSSKVQNTMINYFVSDAKFDLREGCYVCIENNDDQIFETKIVPAPGGQFFALTNNKNSAYWITFGPSYIHGQNLEEIDFPTRNAVDRFQLRKCSLQILLQLTYIYTSVKLEIAVRILFMHQSIPAAPYPRRGQLWGICPSLQSRGKAFS